MKMFIRYVYAGLYATGTMLLLIGGWFFFDLPFHTGAGVLLCMAWLVICFTANRWLHWFYLSVLRVRRTILEEEEWLHPLMHELNLRSLIEPLPELLILETPEMEAYAMGRNTILLSRGLLVRLSEPEIKAVMAHEYGHLKDRDTLTGTVFILADRLPLQLIRFGNAVFDLRYLKLIKNNSWLRKITFLVLLLMLFLAIGDLMVSIVFLILLKFILPVIRWLIWIGWCWLSRVQEYRQDHFAQSLGCGKHLKSALLKIEALHSENLVSRFGHLTHTHPFLFHRIRRIEWLEGLRETP